MKQGEKEEKAHRRERAVGGPESLVRNGRSARNCECKKPSREKHFVRKLALRKINGTVRRPTGTAKILNKRGQSCLRSGLTKKDVKDYTPREWTLNREYADQVEQEGLEVTHSN